MATPQATPEPATTPSPVPTPTPSQIPSVDDLGATRVEVRGFVDWLVMDSGIAWAALNSGMAPLDPVTGKPGRPVTVTGVICTAPAARAGTIWTGTCQNRSLTRIDARTQSVVASIQLPGPGDVAEEGSVASGGGAAWVVTTAPALVKVDATSNKVAGSWPLPDGSAAVRYGLGWLWVTVPDQDLLLRIDPDRPGRRLEIKVGSGPRFLAVGEGAAWTLDSRASTVTKVGRDGSVLATITVGDTPVRGGDMAVGGGYAWARTSDSLIVRIEPDTGATFRIGPRAGSGSVAADEAAAWITAHDVNAIWRLPLPIPEP
jgi:virginiamycin B lyase